MHSSLIRDSVLHNTFDNYYSRGGNNLTSQSQNFKPSSFYDRETADTMILKEIQSLSVKNSADNFSFQNNTRKNAYNNSSKYHQSNYDEILGKEATDYLSKRKKEFSCACNNGLNIDSTKCLDCFDGNIEKYIYNQQNIAGKLLQDFNEKTNLSDNNSSLRFDYQKDELEKVRLLKFYEEAIYKIRKSYEGLLKGGLYSMKKYIIDTIDNYTIDNMQIFNKYLDYFQQRMTRMIVNVLNDEKVDVYKPATTNYIKTQSQILSDEFLDYRDFFPDYTGLINFSNEVSEIKKRFLQDSKNDTLSGGSDLTIKSYQELYRQSLDKISKFKETITGSKKREQSKYYRDLQNGLVPHNEINQFYDNGKHVGMVFPGEGEPIFEIGDKTRKSEPFWKINQLIITKDLRTEHSASDLINDFALVDNNRYVITCSNDRSIKITNMHSGDLKLPMNLAHESPILKIKLLNNGLQASACKDGIIKVFEITLGQLKYTLRGHKDWVWGLDEIAGEALVSVSNDYTMRFWQVRDQLCYKTVISPQNKAIRCLKVQSETRLAFASHKIWIYNTLRDDIEKHFVGHVNFVRCLAYDKKRNYIVSGGEDETIRFWNYDSQDNFKTITVNSAIQCLDLWEGEYVVCGNSNCSILFWDLNLKRQICLKKCKIFPTAIKVTKDGRIIYPEYNSQIVLKNPNLKLTED